MSGFRPTTQTRTLCALALVSIAAVFVLFSSAPVHASTPAIDRAAAEARALMELIDQLDVALGAATEEYNYANQQYEDTQLAAKKTAAQLKRAERDMAAVQGRFDERLIAIYKSRNLNVMGVVLQANSFSQLVTQLDQLKRIGVQDAELVDQIQEFRVETAGRKAQLEEELRMQEVYKAQAEAARQKVLAQIEAQKTALKGKEAEIAKLRKAEAARQAKLAAEERARRAFLSSRPGKVVSLAMQYLGVPYVWGGSSPRGFDCSGLVQYVYAKVGISLPHSSRMQYSCGRPVSRSQLQVGDLVFFFTPIQHVGIYIGNGRMINATGTRVQISDVWPSSFRGGCRVF